MNNPQHWYYADLSLIPYEKAWRLQERLVAARHEARLERDTVLFLEHPPVLTMGRRGGHANLSVSKQFLEESGVQLLDVERGGDITYHGPGQLVVYPIINIRQAGIPIIDFVEQLEEVMIRTVADWGIRASRNSLNRGVWIGNDKLGSIGIAVRRSVTFHGLALNVNPDMSHFSWINPCGLTGVKMTAMAAHTTVPPGVDDVKTVMKRHWENVFNVEFNQISLDTLEQFEKQAGVPDRSTISFPGDGSPAKEP